ncbi:hypothetical protein [Endozoicomonas sp. ONNA2]|uniref:hypothetical protein n=1 Tax=Endozoicomonas sp. ONNA2 TaxID=2828741 RepID=UPI00214993DE|nr:hypothetical protein [Endozoicomonas sp. ONNA2]
MTFSNLPVELKTKVIKQYFSPPLVLTKKTAKAWGRDICNFASTNMELREICQQKSMIPIKCRDICETIKDYPKQIVELMNKYSRYQQEYENPAYRQPPYLLHEPKGCPMLLDALFTGCSLPHARSTFDEYTEEIEQDIKSMVKLSPQSIHCNFGELRCRDNVTPLMAACVNPVIPIEIIELLLENDADPKEKISVSNQSRCFLEDLAENFTLTDERLLQIRELFKRYGG